MLWYKIKLVLYVSIKEENVALNHLWKWCKVWQIVAWKGLAFSLYSSYDYVIIICFEIPESTSNFLNSQNLEN
jgi:hypothetical protein